MRRNARIFYHLNIIQRLNMALAILALVGVILLYGWLRWIVVPSASQLTNTASPTLSQTPSQISQEELAQIYRTHVNSILQGYAFNDSAKAQNILSRVLELTVPKEFKTMHLEVVLALDHAQQGDYAKAQHRITQLKEQFDWFLQ